jgi:OmpA-OmpF porin, OOP family
MKTTSWVAALGIAAATFALPASAQWYVGGGLGQSKFKGELGCDNTAPLSCSDTDTAFKIFGGYRVNRNFATELTYQDFGKASLSGFGVDASIKSRAFDISALGMLPLGDQFAAYGRLGVYGASSEGTSNIGINASQSNGGATYGLGLQFDPIPSLGLRAEYQVYSKVGGGDLGKGDIQVFGVSGLWRF